MGKSVPNKRNFSSPTSSSFHDVGSGRGEGETGDHYIQQKYRVDPQQKNSVKSLVEKLKYFKAREDILNLESVKTVICALGEEEDVRGREGQRKTLETTAMSNTILTTDSISQSSYQDSSSPRKRTVRDRGNMQQQNNGVITGGDSSMDTFSSSKSLRVGGKSSKSSSNSTHQISNFSDSTNSAVSSPSPPDSGDLTTAASSGSPMSNRSVVYAKQGFATLIHNFEHFYKRVAKKYFFMLRPRKPSKSNFFGVFFSILAFIFYYELHTINGFSRLWLKWENVDLSSVECTIESPNLAMELFRPPVSCSICHHVKSVDRVSDISPAEFERMYAYTGRPVIVTDAMTNWTAPSSFSFEFFKGIYSEGSRSLVHLDEDCLFFPYQTEFGSLAEVFNMTKERFQRPWYIGWSNCDAETSHILRHHYQRPYFLPETAESTHADWIFMGTPGHGAHMHIDHVINPSWQGQIKGFKRWYLQPPPECLYECHSFHVDVHPGDIIVLDTNKWYHQTEILHGEKSITIGSEYD